MEEGFPSLHVILHAGHHIFEGALSLRLEVVIRTGRVVNKANHGQSNGLGAAWSCERCAMGLAVVY